MEKFRERLRRKLHLQEETSYWQQDISKLNYIQAFIQGSLLIMAISCLFYNSWIAFPILEPLIIYFMYQWKLSFIQKKKKEFQLQFKDTMQSIATALRAGYSMTNAIKETRRDLTVQYKKEDRIMQELNYMIHQLQMNLPLGQVLEEFASRTRQEDVMGFVSVYIIAQRQGGDMVRIMLNSVDNICERGDVQREIVTILSAKRLEFQIMSLIPFAMIGYMRLSFSEFMSVLYGNIAGILLMSSCLFVYFFAYWIGRKLTEIRV